MILPETLIPIAIGSFIFAGAVKGLVGIGLPTALISVMAQFTDPRTAIALLLVPSLVTNVWQVRRSRYFLGAIRRVWPFALVMIMSTVLGPPPGLPRVSTPKCSLPVSAP